MLKDAPPGGSPSFVLRVLFLLLATFSLSPWASPALALTLGAAFALLLGNPFHRHTGRISVVLLQASVVGLGFGMPLGAVLETGATGIVYTVVMVASGLLLGLWLGRQLRVDGDTSLLVTSGTSICGGTAIAAVGSAIGARAEAMGVALATVFLLNVVALYLFPIVGHLLDLSQIQFGVWAAVAIHDTSSVVGAASTYGPEALETATVLKLARTLWLLPLTLGAAAWSRRRRPVGEGGAARGPGPADAPSPARSPNGRIRIPWFVLFFVLAALVRSLVPPSVVPAFDGISRAARVALVLVLFLIGAGITRATLKAVGFRPLLHALILWIVLGGTALFAVWRWVPG